MVLRKSEGGFYCLLGSQHRLLSQLDKRGRQCCRRARSHDRQTQSDHQRQPRSRPLLSSELRKQPILRPFQSFDRLFEGLRRAGDASNRISPNAPLDTFGCHDIYSQLVYVYGNFGAPSGLEFETFVIMASHFLGQLKSDHDAELARYSDWLPFAKHYERQAQFSNLKDQYEAAYESDPDAFMRIRQQFIQELSAANEYKRSLLAQTDELTALNLAFQTFCNAQ